MLSTIPGTDYHSAHKAPVAAPSVTRWVGSRCAAFTHDITSGPLPAMFGDRCDVLVADLPWQKGFATFNARAGVTDGRTFPAFMRAVAEIVESAACPTYLVTGKHALRHLPAPDSVTPVRLNEDDAIAIAYRPTGEVDARCGTAPELLHALSRTYECVGDFCCGYGRSGRIFLRNGKSAILSDVNSTCVGYVAGRADDWSAEYWNER